MKKKIGKDTLGGGKNVMRRTLATVDVSAVYYIHMLRECDGWKGSVKRFHLRRPFLPLPISLIV